MSGKGILERLKEGPVIGDGGYTYLMERRGYVKANAWTPEVVIEHPDAVRNLHREFLRAGSDVIQTYTFYGSGDKLETGSGKTYHSTQLNRDACQMAREEAQQYDALIAGGISATSVYQQGATKEDVQKVLKAQVDEIVQNGVDFIIAEYFAGVDEAEWAIEVVKAAGLPCAASMRLGPKGDLNGVTPGECAVRMARAGADVVGTNCLFDYKTGIKTIKLMKAALADAGLDPFLMMQPLGWHMQDVEDQMHGYISLPEMPMALEPRLYTRFDARRFAREAFELGVQFMGGCCGFESYHIREMAEELAEVRGRRPPGADKSDVFSRSLKTYVYDFMRHRCTEDYWMNLVPSTGRALKVTNMDSATKPGN